MANELYATTRITAAKSGARSEVSDTFRADMTGDDMYQATQVIGTSSETVSFGDITGAPQLVFIKNLDATNFVELGGDSGLTVFKTKLKAGRFTVFEPSSATLYAKADTANVRIQVIAIEA